MLEAAGEPGVLCGLGALCRLCAPASAAGLLHGICTIFLTPQPATEPQMHQRMTALHDPAGNTAHISWELHADAHDMQQLR